MTFLVLAAFLAAPPASLQLARDQQDRAALQKLVDEAGAAAAKASNDAEAQYQMAMASSYLAEVALEQGDKKLAQQAAERGVKAAEQSVSLKPQVAEYYRVLGTLCGQIVPANVFAGLGYRRPLAGDSSWRPRISAKRSTSTLRTPMPGSGWA